MGTRRHACAHVHTSRRADLPTAGAAHVYAYHPARYKDTIVNGIPTLSSARKIRSVAVIVIIVLACRALDSGAFGSSAEFKQQRHWWL